MTGMGDGADGPQDTDGPQDADGTQDADGPQDASTDPGRPLSEVKAELFRALAHPARIRVLEVLVEGERSVSDLQPLVGIESSHLSQQLGILRRAGLVSNRKDGSSVLYSIRHPATVELLAAARRLLIDSLSETRDLLHGLLEEQP